MKKSIKALLLLAVFLGALVAGINYYVVHEGGKYIAGVMEGTTYTELLSREDMETDTKPEKGKSSGFFDCILVLGAGLSPDGGPSPMLEDRLELAVYLYEEGYAKKILLTGDNGDVAYNEVQAMRGYMDECGIPEEDIVCDYAGFSTYDSMYRARDIFGVKRALVVTQRYHLYRALYIGRVLDMEVYGAASDQETFAGQTHRNAREIVARTKDFVQCLYTPEASIMGEPIRIDWQEDGR